jgi:hypothetical protein
MNSIVYWQQTNRKPQIVQRSGETDGGKILTFINFIQVVKTLWSDGNKGLKQSSKIF